MAIEVGDAVFKFLGDSTQLDLQFDQVGPKAEAAFVPAKGAADGLISSLNGVGNSAQEAGTEIEEGMERGSKAIREAKGEAGLLGEQFGVHLPRHVRSFIAEMPGVGDALSAAFSATAILFIIQAIVQLTEKVSNFISTTFIFTEEMKASTAAIIANNAAILKQKAAYDTAEEALKAFGKSQEQVAHEKVAALNAEIEKQGDIFRTASDNLYGYHHDNLNNFTKAQSEGFENAKLLANKTIEALKAERDKAQLDEAVTIGEHQLKLLALRKQGGEATLALQEALSKEAVAGTQNEEIKKYDITQEFAEKRYQLARNSILKQRSIESQLQKADEVAKLNADLDKLDKEHTQHYEEELDKQKDAFAKTMKAIEAEALNRPKETFDIVTPKSAQNLLQYEAAAAKLGITLKTNLVSALMTAKSAFAALTETGHALPQELKAASAKIKQLQKDLDNFGHSEDNLKVKTETTFKGFQQDLKQGANSIHELSDIGQEAFNDMSKNIQGAFASIVLGQGNVAKALEQATAQSLAQIASQAAVKAIFYTAEGFAALAGFNAGSASGFFTAAAEMAAVAVAAGVAGRALSGAASGGQSTNTQQGSTSNSNTTSQGGSGTSASGVQHFAEGGLVTKPTLAMIGEDSHKEAVLPLEDPRAMAEIGKSIGAAGGGGGIHIHLPHGSIISADVMQKFVGKMNKMVNRGQVHVQASDSFRVTKRSA